MSPIRVAMWSGPRNISTAMMRAWENRGDAAVWDEPLYAYYLRTTGLPHPGADEVIAHGEQDWRKVIEQLVGPVPDEQPVFFQKHMTQHLLEEVDRSWMGEVVNCFLIRDPREVIASYARTRPSVTVEDVGIPQQAEIYDYVAARSPRLPVVLDSRDVLQNPRGILEGLCDSVGVEFTERMLAWPPGPRDSDGVWAKHWYHMLLESTGFSPYKSKVDTLPAHLVGLAEECEPHYRRLYEARLRA